MWINVLNGMIFCMSFQSMTKKHESKETCLLQPMERRRGFYVHNSADNRELTEGLPMS